MGKEQEFLEACKSGDYGTVKKSLESRSKRSFAVVPPCFVLSRFENSSVIYLDCENERLKKSSLVICKEASTGYTALHQAALHGHKDIVPVLLASGADVTTPDKKGCLPLHLAAWAGNKDSVQLLLAHDKSYAVVNCQNHSKEVPLHFSAQHGYSSIVKLLLENGAEANLRNARGETPLDLAARFGRSDSVRLILAAHPEMVLMAQGAEQQPFGVLAAPGETSLEPGINVFSPLHLAARNGKLDVVKILLECGFDINFVTEQGSALHESAVFGKIEVVKHLLEHGIDLSIRNFNGLTALELLAEHQQQKSAEITQLIQNREAWQSIKDIIQNKSSTVQTPSHVPATASQLAQHFQKQTAGKDLMLLSTISPKHSEQSSQSVSPSNGLPKAKLDNGASWSTGGLGLTVQTAENSDRNNVWMTLPENSFQCIAHQNGAVTSAPSKNTNHVAIQPSSVLAPDAASCGSPVSTISLSTYPGDGANSGADTPSTAHSPTPTNEHESVTQLPALPVGQSYCSPTKSKFYLPCYNSGSNAGEDENYGQPKRTVWYIDSKLQAPNLIDGQHVLPMPDSKKPKKCISSPSHSEAKAPAIICSPVSSCLYQTIENYEALPPRRYDNLPAKPTIPNYDNVPTNLLQYDNAPIGHRKWQHACGSREQEHESCSSSRCVGAQQESQMDAASGSGGCAGLASPSADSPNVMVDSGISEVLSLAASSCRHDATSPSLRVSTIGVDLSLSPYGTNSSAMSEEVSPYAAHSPDPVITVCPESQYEKVTMTTISALCSLSKTSSGNKPTPLPRKTYKPTPPCAQPSVNDKASETNSAPSTPICPRRNESTKKNGQTQPTTEECASLSKEELTRVRLRELAEGKLANFTRSSTSALAATTKPSAEEKEAEPCNDVNRRMQTPPFQKKCFSLITSCSGGYDNVLPASTKPREGTCRSTTAFELDDASPPALHTLVKISEEKLNGEPLFSKESDKTTSCDVPSRATVYFDCRDSFSISENLNHAADNNQSPASETLLDEVNRLHDSVVVTNSGLLTSAESVISSQVQSATIDQHATHKLTEERLAPFHAPLQKCRSLMNSEAVLPSDGCKTTFNWFSLSQHNGAASPSHSVILLDGAVTESSTDIAEETSQNRRSFLAGSSPPTTRKRFTHTRHESLDVVPSGKQVISVSSIRRAAEHRPALWFPPPPPLPKPCGLMSRSVIGPVSTSVGSKDLEDNQSRDVRNLVGSVSSQQKRAPLAKPESVDNLCVVSEADRVQSISCPDDGTSLAFGRLFMEKNLHGDDEKQGLLVSKSLRALLIDDDETATPDIPPPNAWQSETEIYDKIMPVVTELKRRSIDMGHQDLPLSLSISPRQPDASEEEADARIYANVNKRPCKDSPPISMRSQGVDARRSESFFSSATSSFQTQCPECLSLRASPNQSRFNSSVCSRCSCGTGMDRTTPTLISNGETQNGSGVESNGGKGLLAKIEQRLIKATQGKEGSASPLDEVAEWDQINNIFKSVGAQIVPRESVFDRVVGEPFAQQFKSVDNQAGLLTDHSLSDWLSSIGLTEVESVLRKFGYDSLTFLPLIDEFCLIAVGVAADYRKLLLATIATHLLAPSMEDYAALSHRFVSDWLMRMDCSDYIGAFMRFGYDTIDICAKSINERILTQALGVQKLGHVQRILWSLDRCYEGETLATANTIKDLVHGGEQTPKIVDSPVAKPAPAKPTAVASMSPIGPSSGSSSVSSSSSNRGNKRISLAQRDVPKSTTPVPTSTQASSSYVWRHDSQQLIHSCVMYSAHYLGSTFVPDPRGNDSTIEAMSKAKKTIREMAKIPQVVLQISCAGVKFTNPVTERVIAEHQIQDIHCVCQDEKDLNCFAYITKEHDKHFCHVFSVLTTDIATEIILTLGQAFQIAYQMAMKSPKTQNVVMNSSLIR